MKQIETEKIRKLREQFEAALKQIGWKADEGHTTQQWSWALGVSPVTFGKRRHQLIQAGQMEHCGFVFPTSDDGKPHRAPLYRLRGSR